MRTARGVSSKGKPNWGLLMLVVTPTVIAASNQPPGTMSEQRLLHADISFALPENREANSIFRKRLVEFAVTRQLRHGPVAVGGGLLGSATYLVVIAGTCEGAIDEVVPAIEYAASKLPTPAAMVSSYRSSAKCEEKEGHEGPQ